MTRDALIEYCRSKPAVTSDFPFDETTLVCRVGGKIFALLDITATPGSASLKCDPETSGDLRAAWPAITPGWHLNKEHWNSLALDGSLPDDLLRYLVDRSWELVEAGLTAVARDKAGLPPRERGQAR
jgi:predicted DNA-binding protein (MmcQ/YjbR family)